MPLIFLIAPVLWLAVLGGFGYLGLRLVRAVERLGARSGDLQEMRDRVTQLELALESSRAEIQRLQEGQEFTARLLSERNQG